ncbi:class I SAM-dependent methyltransferase [Candidatus Peregrinibacteria bacterium]|nr:class I SAM-dependent methyltransferase [Candidatus Peregrinibacteria bacterium]
MSDRLPDSSRHSSGGFETTWTHLDAAAVYDRIVTENPTHQALFERMATVIAAINATHIVDVGGGTALLAQTLRTRGVETPVTIVDPSKEMLQIAHSRNVRGVQLVHKGFGDHTIDRASPDNRVLVVSSYTAHNFSPDTRRWLFTWLQRNLKPGEVFLNGDTVADEPISERNRRVMRAGHFLRAVGAQHWMGREDIPFPEKANILAHTLIDDPASAPDFDECRHLARANGFAIEETWRDPESYLSLLRYTKQEEVAIGT